MSAASAKVWRKNNPVEYAYQCLKDNSKRRGIPFNITLTYFRSFCTRTECIQNKGKTAISYSVDRKKPWLGYVVGNLQVLTLADNSKKQHRDKVKILRYDWQTKTAFVEDITREKGDDGWMDEQDDKGW